MTLGRFHRSRRPGLRLALALLLVLLPLLTHALPQLVHTDDIGAAPMMPCHGTPGDLVQTPAPEIENGCPHCCGEAPASQCHCCGFTAPAGLPELAFASPLTLGDGKAIATIADDPLPDSPDDPFYRPPITGI